MQVLPLGEIKGSLAQSDHASHGFLNGNRSDLGVTVVMVRSQRSRCTAPECADRLKKGVD